ncbi:MAG: TetR/AcrR family transcriptional regulator [Coriobacteriales bacterium]|jgi:AcrR family transcriptional regulator
MVNYANGMETRGIIIETCKKLFLEKGYKNTTYSEIYKAAMVNPGTIAHHFGNKRNIASMLYDEVMVKLTNYTVELFPDEDDVQRAFLGVAMHRKIAYDDERWRRFVMEFMLDDLANDDESRYIANDFKAYKTTQDQVGASKATFLFVAYKGIEAAIDSYYGRHPGKMTFEDMYTYYASMYFGYLPREEVEERTKKAIEDVKGLKLDIGEFDPIVEKI